MLTLSRAPAFTADDDIGQPIIALNYLNARTEMDGEAFATVENLRDVARNSACAVFMQSRRRRCRHHAKPVRFIRGERAKPPRRNDQAMGLS